MIQTQYTQIQACIWENSPPSLFTYPRAACSNMSGAIFTDRYFSLAQPKAIIWPMLSHCCCQKSCLRKGNLKAFPVVHWSSCCALVVEFIPEFGETVPHNLSIIIRHLRCAIWQNELDFDFKLQWPWSAKHNGTRTQIRKHKRKSKNTICVHVFWFAFMVYDLLSWFMIFVRFFLFAFTVFTNLRI